MLERRILVCVCLLVGVHLAGGARPQAAEHKHLTGTFYFGHEALPLPVDGTVFTEPLYQVGYFSGRGTHIGSFIGTGDVTVYFLAPPVEEEELHYAIPLDRVAITYFEGDVTWTRPEGSLFGTFSGWNYLLTRDELPDELQWLPDYMLDELLEVLFGAVVHLTITDGTGRFQGAEGELLAFGLDDPFGILRGDGTGGVNAEFAGTLTLGRPPHRVGKD